MLIGPWKSWQALTKSVSQNGKWSEQLVAWRDRLQISDAYEPFTKLGLEIHGLRMTPRIHGLLNLVVADRLQVVKAAAESQGESWRATKKNVRQAIADLVIDVSQNPVRRAFSNNEGVAHALCSGSMLAHLGLGRMILPAELMWLQGHNPQKARFPDAMTQEQIRALAGEGMALPCLGLCIWSQFLVKGFPDA